ncbi:DUF2059 domain-containing protein [Xanthobacter autotrophicus DSM 431]|uniref:DUF2059 domain-containing protein n=1 Tax=Xanthobacter nonsaccharivorans TaxID=3119912 RepID=UPI0037264FD6
MRVSKPGANQRAHFASRLVLAAALSLAGTAALGVVPATAQQAAPAAKATAAHLQLARDLVMANGEGRAFDGIIPNIVEGAERRYLQTNPDLAQKLRESAVEVAKELDKRKSEIVDLLAMSYASHFSEAELKEAIAFFRSPTGTKLVQDRPVIVQEAVQGIQAWGAQLNAQASELIRAEMKKRGVDL